MDNVLQEPLMIFGGYIENASMSVGYGTESGTCQLSVVFEGDGPKRTYDFEKNIPEVGTAVGFIFGGCKFGGILQRYTHRKSIDGYKWDLIIESPGKWLDGIQIILDMFNGDGYNINGTSSYSFTNQVDNIWNPFAILENYQYGGYYGGANVNSAGFVATEALRLIQEISQGLHLFGGPAHFGNSYYEVDLSEVIRITPQYFRLKGPVQSLGSIIQECCDMALYDYVVFIDTKGVTESGVIEKPKIKVKVIDKSFIPDSTVIKQFVENYEKRGLLISADNGREFPDVVTQRLVLGGAASRIATSNSNSAFPIWGKLPNGGNYIVGSGLEMNSEATIYIKATSSMYVTNVLEIRCAMSGFNTWVLYHLLKNKTFPCFTNIGIDEYQLQGLIDGTLTVNQILNISASTGDYMSQMYTGENFMEFLNKIYDEIRQAGEEFYGRKFLVPLPFEPGGFANNIKFVSEDFQFYTSWQISDSGWSLSKPFKDLAFYDGDGRLKSYASWQSDSRYDYSSLGSDWDVSISAGLGIGTHKVSVEKEIIWYNATPYAVVDVPPVAGYDDITTQQYGLFHLCKIILDKEPNLNVLASFGSENGPLTYNICPRRVAPQSFGIAQESNRYTWGPWWWFSDKRGKAEILVEETLKPETFGSFATLDTVGFAYATTSGATVHSSESGYVELAEIPTYSLAEKFATNGPYVSGMDINISSGGIKTTYKFNTWTPQFGKLAKYNADRISNIRKNYLRFLQDKRSRWAKPPMPSKDFKGVGAQSHANMISPVWGMHAMNTVLAHLVGVGGKDDPESKVMPNMIAGNITNALPVLSKQQAKCFGAGYEQIYSPGTILNASEAINMSSGSPIPGYSDLNPYFPSTSTAIPHSSKDTDFQLCVGPGMKNYDLSRQENKSLDSVQTTACFRAPVLISGWGFSLDDSPVPSGDSRSFSKTAAINRSEWKTGPLHLMWDDEREVWAGGHAMLEGVLASDIAAPTNVNSPTKFLVLVKRTGWNSYDEIVECVNRDPTLSVSRKSQDVYVIIVRLNYEWKAIYVGCP